MIPKTADVVIIGAGVVGCSIAYHLAKRGFTNVVVLEKNQIGSGSTSKGAGGIRQQHPHELEIKFSQEGIRCFKRFEEEMGCSADFRQYGYLFLLGDEQTVETYKQNFALQRSLGAEVEWLSPQETRKVVPQLNVDDLLGATYCPADGYAGTHEVTQGFAQRARQLGVRILEGRGVVGIKQRNGSVRAVQVVGDEIATPMVVNAAGPWAAQIGDMVGIRLPVEPMWRHIFVTEPFDQIINTLPMVMDTHQKFYCRSELQAVLMSSMDMIPVKEYKAAVEWDVLNEAIEKAIHRLPALEGAKIAHSWAGMRAITPDERAILGPVPEVEGFICAVGFSGHGFQHAPATGRVIAELIIDGQTSPDISPLSVTRFAADG